MAAVKKARTSESEDHAGPILQSEPAGAAQEDHLLATELPDGHLLAADHASPGSLMMLPDGVLRRVVAGVPEAECAGRLSLASSRANKVVREVSHVYWMRQLKRKFRLRSADRRPGIKSLHRITKYDESVTAGGMAAFGRLWMTQCAADTCSDSLGDVEGSYACKGCGKALCGECYCRCRCFRCGGHSGYDSISCNACNITICSDCRHPDKGGTDYEPLRQQQVNSDDEGGWEWDSVSWTPGWDGAWHEADFIACNDCGEVRCPSCWKERVYARTEDAHDILHNPGRGSDDIFVCDTGRHAQCGTCWRKRCPSERLLNCVSCESCCSVQCGICAREEEEGFPLSRRYIEEQCGFGSGDRQIPHGSCSHCGGAFCKTCAPRLTCEVCDEAESSLECSSSDSDSAITTSRCCLCGKTKQPCRDCMYSCEDTKCGKTFCIDCYSYECTRCGHVKCPECATEWECHTCVDTKLCLGCFRYGDFLRCDCGRQKCSTCFNKDDHSGIEGGGCPYHLDGMHQYIAVGTLRAVSLEGQKLLTDYPAWVHAGERR